jgi:NADH:ubiquinone oxidoreductase subunit 6 (subunit J)
MVYAERNTWAQVIATVVGLVVYVGIVAPQLGTTAVAEIQWAWPMIGVIVGAIVLSIVVSILWGIGAGMRDPDASRADQRDREIEWLGGRVGQAFMVLGGLAGIVLAMLEADWFWIGNALFLGFASSSLLDGITRIVVYRRGMPRW